MVFKKAITILFTMVLISLLLGSFVVGYLYNSKKETSNEIKVDKVVENITSCENKTLSDTAEFLKDYVKTFYNYTVRGDTDKTLEDIKLNGGDCYDWSNLYKKMFESLGFNGRLDKIYSDDKSSGHSYLIAWDKNLTQFCYINSLEVNCFNSK